jgi:hypothetical protein
VVLDRTALGQLRAALGAAGYTRDNVSRALMADHTQPANPGEVVVFERRLAARTPLDTLTRLLLIGSTVMQEDLEASLPSIGLSRLEHLGLVVPADGGVRSTVRIIPHGDIVLACDRGYYGDSDLPGADVVTGVNSPATLLADMTTRKRVGTALDLGTGGGIQALLLAHHCERVVAIDVNRRALAFAELNCCLNGVENIELRLGSWFEPVEGERFDIVTANPPYVMSPDSTFLYRDSGMRADSLCRQLVTDMPRFLTDGGVGHILISWALRAGEEWSKPLRGWVEGLPCDAWLLHYLTEDPLTHAAKWNQPLVSEGLAAYGEAIERWTRYYEREGIEQIAFGAVLLRRRAGGSNWVRADTFRAGKGSSAGLVLRVFEAEDFLRGLRDDRSLLNEKFALVPEHRLDQGMRSIDGQWTLEDSTLTLTQGIAFSGTLDLNTAQLLQHFDGRNTLKQAVAKASRELRLPPGDTASLADTAIAMAKRLYQLGFLDRLSA